MIFFFFFFFLSISSLSSSARAIPPQTQERQRDSSRNDVTVTAQQDSPTGLREEKKSRFLQFSPLIARTSTQNTNGRHFADNKRRPFYSALQASESH